MPPVLEGYVEGLIENSWTGLFEFIFYGGYPKHIAHNILVSGKMGDDQIPAISRARGFPEDISTELQNYLEQEFDFSRELDPELYGRSYLYLEEILSFNWNLEVDDYGKKLSAREAMGDEFWTLISRVKQEVKRFDRIRFVIWFTT